MRRKSCSKCGGSGKFDEVVEHKRTCWNCSGRGWYRHLYDEEKITCKRCAGKGSMLYHIRESSICSQCDGQGYVSYVKTDKEQVFPPNAS